MALATSELKVARKLSLFGVWSGGGSKAPMLNSPILIARAPTNEAPLEGGPASVLVLMLGFSAQHLS